jgi:hypothetical protein
MRKAEIIVSVVLFFLSALVIYDALRLGTGWGLEGPQPGFFIFWLAIGLGACSLAALVRAVVPSPAPVVRFVDYPGLISVLKVLVPASALVALLPWVGFYLGASLYMAFYMRRIGAFGWRAIAVAFLLFPTALFLIFEKWLRILLPKGVLTTILVF